MARTRIEYGERSWNPLTGCTVVSEGCRDCWARSMAKRLKAAGRPEYQDAVDDKGQWTGRITLVPERLNEPSSWRKPQHVLVEYMGDLFHEHVPVDYILRVFNVMDRTPQHTYQTLTKRASNMEYILLNEEPVPNVILGVTVENQRRANERREFLSILAERGWRTWVSYEPALSHVNWKGWEFISQLVAGGENSPNARPMHPDWMRSARDWCLENDVPFFFKQWGSWYPVVDLYDEEGPDEAFKFAFEFWEAHVEPGGYVPVLTPPLGQQGGWHEFQPARGRISWRRLGRRWRGVSWTAGRGARCRG